MDPNPTTARDLQEWQERRINSHERMAPPVRGVEWDEVLASIKALPPETPEERAIRERLAAEAEHTERVAKFRKLCPPEFMQRVNRGLLTDPAAFDRVVAWTGAFPGPICSGKTGCSKTRAAWAALYRLNVIEGRSFAWFPVKRLMTEFIRYESKDLADEFWRFYKSYNVLLVDDADKINWQFESEMAALFQFYDWVYREHRPCITTTNKGRAWWADKMGEAFARRLFDEAHTLVAFAP